MKKLWVLLGASVICLHVDTAAPMMAGLNKIVKPIYEKYIKRKPAPYTFYAPRDSYSYFSPHFNMYHYVGVDYTTSGKVTSEDIQKDLATGIRGFTFTIKRIENQEAYVSNAKNTLSSLTGMLSTIVLFAEQHNEIVIVHITNAHHYSSIIHDHIKSIKYPDLLFTPLDRLKDIDKNAAKKRTIDTANKNGLTVWPRLKWNYANKKLVMITWDSTHYSDYCWRYDQYFTHNLSDSKKLIESSVDSISATMPVATAEHPTIFYSDALKTELVSGLSFVTWLAICTISNYLYSLCSQPISYQPAFDPMTWIKNPDIIPANAKQTFDTILAKVRTFGPENPNNPLNLNNEGFVYLRYRLKELYTPTRVYTYYPSRFLELWTNLIASASSSLTALGIYAIGHTKNAFTVVKKENIPAAMAVTGVFLKQPLSLGDAITISDNKSPIFNAVSQLNRQDYTLINTFERSLLLQIAHHGRRAASPITNRLLKKR
jgi:hypothetical protein